MGGRMTIDHTGHAAGGCPQFDLTQPPRKASESPDDLHLVNITGIPAKAFRAARVIDDECMECNGPLGEEWHVSRQKVICQTCFLGRVRMANVIDMDSYRELPE
jgi:hypothetical protein